MAYSRRKFLTGAAAGVGASLVGVPSGRSEQAPRADIPTPRAKALMEIFGLRYPIFQAPSGGADLASAISNAGGMGAIPLWRTSSEIARDSVTRLRGLTKQPFIVNYVLTFEPQSLPAAVDAGAPVVQFSWGVPAKATVSAIQRARAKFGVQVATAEGARAALDAGAAYLVAQGQEAGGHVQSSTPLHVILPKVLAEARDIPVLVAGGISTGAHLRTALLAGAAGALLGTRFMATQESNAHPEYKHALVQSNGADAALSVCFQDGWPAATHRTLRNGTLTRWEAAGCPPPGQRPGEGDVVATGPNGRERFAIRCRCPSETTRAP